MGKQSQTAPDKACIVFDVGKTFAKVSAVTADGKVRAEKRTRTPIFHTPLYSALDVDTLFDWLLAELKTLAADYAIDRVIPVAHGAACAFLDDELRLVQPLQDYESAIPAAFARSYAQLRPAFAETLSPALPKGLNLGAQIYWHERRDPAMFARVRWILPYPQYWAWRLSGELTCEITSLGCHSDLWSPAAGDFSTLAHARGWAERFAPMRKAWDTAGLVRPQIARATGLSADTKVCVGLHDTNSALAALLLDNGNSDAPALLSTGTWFIAMAPGAPIDRLQAERDCLAGVDIFGKPVACARFMGGRAFELITRATGQDGTSRTAVDADTLTSVMHDAALAMPSFLDAGGPYPGLRGEIRGLRNDTPQTRAALGLLYQALVSTTCLDLIQAGRTLLIEGAAARNPTLCGLIAALHDGPVQVNGAVSGVTLGAAGLAFRGEAPAPALTRRHVKPLLANEMRAYQALWTAAVNNAIAA